MKSKFLQYYVEGDDEKKLINILKTDLGVIRPGNVQTLNVVQNEIGDIRLRSLRRSTMVVLIFDTDAGNVSTLNQNLEKLKGCPAVTEIVTIPQVHNLEEELVRSCNIKKAADLLGSRSQKDFKSDLIRVTNLANKLQEHKFDINLFWCKTPEYPYQNIKNQAEKIKLLD